MDHSIALVSELLAFVERVDTIEARRAQAEGASSRLSRVEIAEALAEALARRADCMAVVDTPLAPRRSRPHDYAVVRRPSGVAARIAHRLGVNRRNLHLMAQAYGRTLGDD